MHINVWGKGKINRNLHLLVMGEIVYGDTNLSVLSFLSTFKLWFKKCLQEVDIEEKETWNKGQNFPNSCN